MLTLNLDNRYYSYHYYCYIYLSVLKNKNMRKTTPISIILALLFVTTPTLKIKADSGIFYPESIDFVSQICNGVDPVSTVSDNNDSTYCSATGGNTREMSYSFNFSQIPSGSAINSAVAHFRARQKGSFSVPFLAISKNGQGFDSVDIPNTNFQDYDIGITNNFDVNSTYGLISSIFSFPIDISEFFLTVDWTPPGVVKIDIKPNSDPNSINTKSHGKIPVALLSSSDLDVLTEIDSNSFKFGRTGDEMSLAFCNKNGEDVNGDGLLDLVCHFETQNTGFQLGDLVGVLSGKTNSGQPVRGEDNINIVK